MIIKAQAKLNLAIDLLGRREDGYHNIDMISIPLELHDCLEVDELSIGNETYITADDVSLVCDESNTVNMAFKLMKEKYNLKKPFRIQIYKNIPTQAGLAGGSADAACLINHIAKIKKTNATQDELAEIGFKIGADVPFCIYNKPSRVQGVGEILTPIKAKYAFYVLIVKPKTGLPTKNVYNKCNEIHEDYHPDIAKLAELLENNPKVEDLVPYLYNGLRPAAEALCPEITTILSKMKELGLNACEMSGSGTSCFALTQNEKELEKVAKVFQKMGYQTIKTSAGFQHKSFPEIIKRAFKIK